MVQYSPRYSAFKIVRLPDIVRFCSKSQNTHYIGQINSKTACFISLYVMRNSAFTRYSAFLAQWTAYALYRVLSLYNKTL